MLNFVTTFFHRIEIENDMLVCFARYFIKLHAEEKICFSKPARRILIPILYSLCLRGTGYLDSYVRLLLFQCKS